MAGKTVLVIDNEIDQLEFMEQIIGRFGHRVLTAVDGATAARTVREQSVDIVFADLIMPDMDGTELCEKLKQIRPDMKVIAFSGHAALYPASKLKRVGFDGILAKPVDIRLIEMAIQDAAALPDPSTA